MPPEELKKNTTLLENGCFSFSVTVNIYNKTIDRRLYTTTKYNVLCENGAQIIFGQHDFFSLGFANNIYYLGGIVCTA